MLRCNDLAWLGLELGTDLATPRAVFEALVLPRGSLDRRDVRPCFVVAGTISMMHGIEDAKLRCARGIQDLQHVGNAIVCFSDSFDQGPELAALGNEVVVRIDHQKGSELPFVCSFCHERTCAAFPRATGPYWQLRQVSSTGYFCPVASRIMAAILSGCDMSERWLAFISIVFAPMRFAIKRWRSGLIVRSS